MATYPDHPHRILIVGGSGSGKTNVLLNLINNQPDIDKIYLYAKDPYEAKYHYLINKRKKVGLDHLKDPKAFMEYSNDMEDVYKNIENYNPGKKRKILIVFDDMIADMINNKKLNPVVTELFIRGRKLNISIVFITQSYFRVLKDVRLNSTHFFIMKIPNKRELQQIALHHSSDIDFKDFIKIYKKWTMIIMSRNSYDSKQEGTGFKILTPKQMLQRLPIALAQVKAGNNSQSLLNEVR